MKNIKPVKLTIEFEKWEAHIYFEKSSFNLKFNPLHLFKKLVNIMCLVVKIFHNFSIESQYSFK